MSSILIDSTEVGSCMRASSAVASTVLSAWTGTGAAMSWSADGYLRVPAQAAAGLRGTHLDHSNDQIPSFTQIPNFTQNTKRPWAPQPRAGQL